MTLLRGLPAALALLALLCAAALPQAGRADDIDVYRNPAANTYKPPATIITLDLNVLGICDNVLLPPTSALNPSVQSCIDVRATTPLSSVLTSNPTQFLTSLGPATLCTLATSLGAATPTIVVPLVGNLTCGTLGTLGGLSAVAPLLTGFTASLVTAILGVLNPYLSTMLAMLPTTVSNALNTAIPAIRKIAGPPGAVANLANLLTTLLNQLINTQVAIVVAHNNIGNASANPVPYKVDTVSYPNGNRYACDFNDVSTAASVSGKARNDTTNCSNGAYFLVSFTNLVDSTSINAVLAQVTGKLTNLLDPVTGFISLTNLSNSLQTTINALLNGNTLALTPPYQGKEIYDEIFHYVNGDVLYNARQNTYDGLFTVLSRDTSIESGSKYIAPTLSCRTLNVLNIEATNSLYDNDSDLDINSPYISGVDLNPAGGSASPPTATGFGNLVAAAQTTGFPTGATNRFKLNSYFVIRDNLSSTSALGNTGANLLTYSGALGLFGLGKTISDLLKSTLVTDASIVTATAATSRAFNSGLLESGTGTSKLVHAPAFFSEFKPQSNRGGAWYGNVKRLELVQLTNASSSTPSINYYDARCSLSSAAGGGCSAAIDPTDGRIATTALTYWTRTGALGTAGVDGRETTLGGAGQNIPGYQFGGGGTPGRKNADGARQLYYDSASAGLTDLNADSNTVRSDLLTDTGAADETAATCGAAKTADAVEQELLLYARGYDVGTSCAGSKGSGGSLKGRSWMMGAVLHSRPVAINYGGRSGYSAADPDIRVLFGSADGFLRMVKNGAAASPSGTESWAFMPRAVMGNLKTLRDNAFTPQLPTGVDGAPAVLVAQTNATTGVPGKVYAFFGLRRSGSSVYGLDLSNPDVPAMLWRISPAGLVSATASKSSTTGFAELGMTFSTPAIGKVKLDSETSFRSVVVFAGGYNGGYAADGTRIGKDLNNSRNTGTGSPDPRLGTDDQPASGSGRGNALYMVDATTGELLWKAAYGGSANWNAGTRTFTHPQLLDSIPSDVTLVDTDGDGVSDRLYVGDTGGRVWRADFPGSDRSKWTLSLFADLGRHLQSATSTNAFADDRRFFQAPDYAPYRDSNGAYDSVVIGSGDREDPFNTTTTNYVYALRDRDTVSGKSLTDGGTNGVITSAGDARVLRVSDAVDLTTACASGGSNCAASFNLSKGWKLKLAGSGEAAASTPVSLNGNVYFSTFLSPNTTSCTPSEGSGRTYGVSLADSRPIFARFADAAGTGSRYKATTAPGLQGGINALTTTDIAVNADTLDVTARPTTRVFWRERREDEELPVPQTR